jgi:hypothetical protein
VDSCVHNETVSGSRTNPLGCLGGDDESQMRIQQQGDGGGVFVSESAFVRPSSPGPQVLPDGMTTFSPLVVLLRSICCSGAVRKTNGLASLRDNPSDPAAAGLQTGGSYGKQSTRGTSPLATLPEHFPIASVLDRFPHLNKWERLVDMDRFTILDDPFLRKTPYVINSYHNALICADCKHAVSPKSSAPHLRSAHRSRNIPRGLDKYLAETYPLLKSGPIHPDDTCDPIFGLAIPLNEFLICTRCRRGYTDTLSWRSHSCKAPHVELNGRPAYFSSLVQTFFLGTRLCYFPVNTPSSRIRTQDDFTLFKAQFPDIDASVQQVTESNNYREIHQFLEKEGWIEHTANCTASKLAALVSLPCSRDPLSKIAPNLCNLLTNVQDIISKGVFHVRRLLGRRPS